jgi:hypothetical protein
MPFRLFLVLWTCLALGGAPRRAAAAPVAVAFCIEYELDFTDEDSGDSLVADTMPAKGAEVRFHRSSDGVLLTSGYLDWDGSTPGCDVFALNDAVTYDVKVARRALVNGNRLEVRDNPTNNQLFVTTVRTNYVPVHATQVNESVGPTASVRILAAASWAMAGSNGGVALNPLNSFNFFATSGCGNTSCESWPETGIFIKTDHSFYKFIIVHELGHAVTEARVGAEDENDDGAALNGCNASGPDQYDVDGHQMNSKEFSSQAYVEGIANLYAAAAFNTHEVDAPCQFETHYRPDWDADGTDEQQNEPFIFSCENGVSSAGVNATDYLGQFCLAAGATTNRATEYDVLRGMWDLISDEGVGVPTLFSIWEEARPDTWTMNGTGTGNDFPAERMHDAAFTVGGSTLQDQWDDVADDNGIDR